MSLSGERQWFQGVWGKKRDLPSLPLTFPLSSGLPSPSVDDVEREPQEVGDWCAHSYDPWASASHLSCELFPITFQSTVGLQEHGGPTVVLEEPVLVIRSEDCPLGVCILRCVDILPFD